MQGNSFKLTIRYSGIILLSLKKNVCAVEKKHHRHLHKHEVIRHQSTKMYHVYRDVSRFLSVHETPYPKYDQSLLPSTPLDTNYMAAEADENNTRFIWFDEETTVLIELIHESDRNAPRPPEPPSSLVTLSLYEPTPNISMKVVDGNNRKLAFLFDVLKIWLTFIIHFTENLTNKCEPIRSD